MSTILTVTQYAKSRSSYAADKENCSRQAVLKAIISGNQSLLPGVIEIKRAGKFYLLLVKSS